MLKDYKYIITHIGDGTKSQICAFNSIEDSFVDTEMHLYTEEIPNDNFSRPFIFTRKHNLTKFIENEHLIDTDLSDYEKYLKKNYTVFTQGSIVLDFVGDAGQIILVVSGNEYGNIWFRDFSENVVIPLNDGKKKRANFIQFYLDGVKDMLDSIKKEAERQKV